MVEFEPVACDTENDTFKKKKIIFGRRFNFDHL